MIAAGAVWIAAALVIPLMALEQRATDTLSLSGLVDFFTTNTGTLFLEGGLGIIRLIALAVASGFCLFVGITLCVFGFVPKEARRLLFSQSAD